MNIFQDIHTYIFISFILMGYLLYKFTYKKIDSNLTKNIDEIRGKITYLENKKLETAKLLESLEKELKVAKLKIDESIIEAKTEAKKITEQSGEEINNIVSKKQNEYENTIKKIKKGLSSELQNKIVKLVIKNLVEKLKNVEDNREIQNINIDNSIKMLEDLADSNTNREDDR